MEEFYKRHIKLAVLMCDFFGFQRNKQMKKLLGLPINTSSIAPLSLLNFFTYLEIIIPTVKFNFNELRYIAKKLENCSVLKYVGNNGKAISGDCFYCYPANKATDLWLSGMLGLDYLCSELMKNNCKITGFNKNDVPGNGSGFLIAPNYVLTCKHCVEMNDIKVYLQKQLFNVVNIHKDNKYDIAIIEISAENSTQFKYPIFSKGHLLEEVLVMGFPNIQCAFDDYLLCQKGEINCCVDSSLAQCSCLIISTTAKPGNSGGPVISRSGHLVGMVFGDSMSSEVAVIKEEDIKKTTNEIPYFWAIDGMELYNSVKKLVPKLNIQYDDNY